jgi:1-acyl-sn-glycerol-3-phosphate acyltransferase
VKTLVALYKLLRGLGHMLKGVWWVHMHFPKLSPEHSEAWVQAWSLQLLALWNIRLHVLGQPVRNGPMLLVANHISWLDIVVMHAARHCRFVSKSDVQEWPLIGTLARGCSTLFIQRTKRRDAMRVVQEMTRALQAGDVVAIFPEGTTGDGLHLLPFHANLIQAAIAADAPVQPMALKFVDRQSGAISLAPAYIGDDSLLDSVWRTLTAEGIDAVVHFGEPQIAQGRDRRAWAHDLREEVIRLNAAAQRVQVIPTTESKA